MGELQEWYNSLAPFTKLWFTASVVAALCLQFDYVTAFNLAYLP
jgi:hypothetical protein